MENLQLSNSDEPLITLLDTIMDVNKVATRSMLINGEAFTPFIPGIIDLDEQMASRILKMLLDPHDNHGQGDFFLRKFLELLPLQDVQLALKPGNIIDVSTEKTTYGMESKRRLDIYVETEKFCMGIENKLGAEDQKKQLADYLAWLASKSIGKQYFLVYLTPSGDESSDFSLPEPHKTIYKDHIYYLSWRELIDCLTNLENRIPANIYSFIKDFCKAVKNLKLKEKEMAEKKEIIECLANRTTDDQLKAAGEIYASWEAASEQIIKDWLNQLQEALAGKVKGQISTSTVYFPSDKETDYFTVKYPELRVDVRIMQLGYPHGGVPAFTVLWGEVIHTWDFPGGKQEAINDPWIQYLMNKLKCHRLIGNMTGVHACKSPLDADFLARIRKKPLYLLEEILTSCENIEKWAAEFKAAK